MEQTVLSGKIRKKTGTRDAWNQRKEGWVPANLYGHGEANVHFYLRESEITKTIYDGHHMITLDIDGKQDQGLMKEIQFDTLGDHIIHVDFARVSLDEVVETLVPIHTQGIPKGVSSGGILDIPHHEVVLRGKARDLPEFIDVEISHLGLGESVRCGELVLPEGVEAVLAAEEPVVIVHQPRGQDEDGDGEDGPSEPEVIGGKKDDS